MDVLDRAQGAVHRMVDEGRERADHMRRQHERSRLFKELGELCYDKHRGGVDPGDEFDHIMSQLDGLEDESRPTTRSPEDPDIETAVDNTGSIA